MHVLKGVGGEVAPYGPAEKRSKMTAFQSLQASLAPELKLLNEGIEQALSSPNELMNAVIFNYLKKKGKQIRPMLVMLSAKLIGKVSEKTVTGAVAVELLHNASLIHDDVVDETKTRRGVPTINGSWDNHLAVLVGDFFLSNALMQSVATDDLRIVEAISNLGRLLSVGELDEIQNARFTSLDEETYYRIIYRKTASLFVACAEVGAYSVEGGVTDDQLARLREFARLLGLCFQIKDDIFDYFSDEKIGKPTGNDLREGKVTLPLLHALSKETHPECAELRALACRDSLTSAEIERLIAFAVENGGIDYAYASMERLRAEAAGLLAPMPDQAIAADMLRLFDFVIARDI